MSFTLVAIVGILTLFALVLFRMPISFAMFVVGYFGMMHITSPAAANNIISSGIWGQLSSYSLSIIPLFIFMGELLFRSGITRKIFASAYAWIGHWRGSMATTTILSCAGFAAVSGSNTATAATVGTIALPEMKKFGYNKSLSSGSVATGGTLGVIIPPSSVLIVIALQAQLPVRDLFIASIIPGLILVSLFIVMISLLCYRNPEMAPAGERCSWRKRISSLKGVIEVVLLFMLVLGGLFTGWFTSTEAAAVGCVGAMAIVATQGKFTLVVLKDSIASSLRSSAMILMLITGAVIFGRFLTVTRLPYLVGEWAATLPLPAVVIMGCVLLIYVIGGALMDAMGFLIISIPIFFPVADALGYDLVWFGVMVCIVTSMGAITPPVGVNAFIVKSLDVELSIGDIFKGVGYFMLPYLACIFLLLFVPEIILFVL
ncbi:TRAP transporter large permease subunit [Halomonas sp. McH1-25]|uniref:TRAP transporter large permease n=1 Tax=unclassified Halomonas TaxID=2609666 RepID=UPI001EF42D71|nr:MULTISPECIES: TRAP transporter large permease subunit [unclassified Halomonas]MCG7602234.1 TRAP transporter large permease subunit [Halomonas sp. McH1-25]MCP1344589.1 TRAP transporter large permease subunit [Halomonas sp. FL8]MCP1362863.1 TRAP transporter large permease subunit [Halomonas sp. BBD45]MCP1363739.1 TRAP transporter large permease subunit [Halomonas sp. BBD48]